MSAGTQPHRLSVDDVFRMVEAGVLGEEDRVELIDGVLVDVTPPSPEHSAAVAWLTRRLIQCAGGREVRVQDLLLVEGGFVMPDLMVVDPVTRGRHPSTAPLVVEVAVSTQRHDAAKAARYAKTNVEEYWIVDLRARVVTVHREPTPHGYARIARYRDGDRIHAEAVTAEIDVTELLGPAAA